MITLITGLPGNGKTLYGINYIKAYAEKENREVYYSGIKDLLLPWTEFKAEEWFTLPSGAIIVMDEAQFNFPKKPNGSKLPEHYERLATHRHNGHDIFLITQHPSLLDNFVRMLAGRHLHLIRKFGMQRANVWEWPAANTAPEKASSHKSAILHKFAYPKEVYGYYKSAEVHTVKRSIPAKLILAVLFVVSVLGIGYYVLDRFQKKATGNKELAVQGSSAGSSVSAASTAPVFDPLADARRYVHMQTPRVDGLPYTAPKYDELTRPTAVPMAAACVYAANRCQCYTQQGTKIATEFNVCLDIAHNGYFQEFDHHGKNIIDEKRNYNVRVLEQQSSLPISGAQTSDVSQGAAVVFGYSGSGGGVRSPAY